MRYANPFRNLPIRVPRKWREVKSRPVQGNSPNDRILRGPDCNRPKRVCVDSFPATPPQPPGTRMAPGMRFFRHAESIGPMGSLTPVKAGAGVPPPVGRPPGPSPRARRKVRALLIVRDEFRPAIPRSGCSPAEPVSASPAARS